MASVVPYLLTFKGNWAGSTEVALSFENGSHESVSGGGLPAFITPQQNPVGVYYWNIKGFFAETESQVHDNAAQTQALVVSELGLADTITEHLGFFPPIEKRLARGGVTLWSPHDNAGSLKLYRGPTGDYAGGNAVTLSSECWLKKYNATTGGRNGIATIDYQFVSSRNPVDYIV